MAHPSWDSKVLYGGNYPDAVETAILEKNEGRLNGDFACVSTTFLGDSNRDETEIATYCTYLYRSYDVETKSYEQLFEHVKMDFDIEKDEFGIYQFTLTSYELLDPAKLDGYKTSSGDLAFRNHSLEPSDNMMQNCDDQFAEYLEYLEKYQ